MVPPEFEASKPVYTYDDDDGAASGMVAPVRWVPADERREANHSQSGASKASTSSVSATSWLNDEQQPVQAQRPSFTAAFMDLEPDLSQAKRIATEKVKLRRVRSVQVFGCVVLYALTDVLCAVGLIS